MKQAPGSRRDLTLLARGGTLGLVGLVANGLLGFLLVVLLTRGAGAERAGVLFEAIALFTILANAAELGADTGLVRWVARYLALGRSADLASLLRVSLWPVLGVAALAAAVVFMSAPALARWFVEEAHRGEVARLIRLLAPFLPLAAVTTVALAGTRGFGTVLPLVAVQYTGLPAARVLLVGLVLAAGMDSVAVLLGWAAPLLPGAVAAVAALLFLLSRTGRHSRGRRTLEPEGKPPRRRGPEAVVRPSISILASEFWRFSAPRGLAGLFQITVVWVDLLILGAFRPAGDVGVYAAIGRTVLAGLFVLQAVRLAIAPQLSRLLAREDRAGAQHIYEAGTRWTIIVSWPLYLTLAVFAPLVLRVFGPEFPAGQHALVILALAMLVGTGTGNVSTVLLMGGRSGWNLANTTLALIVNVVANLALVPRFGITGAAVAWALTIVVENAAPLAEIALLLKISPFGSAYPIVALAALASYGGIALAFRLWLGPSAVALAAAVVLGTVVYLAILARQRENLGLPSLRPDRPGI
jgi:O-antigen/teichoic acid export membrane protein